MPTTYMTKKRNAYASLLWRLANELQAEAEGVTDHRQGIKMLAAADALIAMAKAEDADPSGADVLADIEATLAGRDIEPTAPLAVTSLDEEIMHVRIAEFADAAGWTRPAIVGGRVDG